jgi:hypothetical protein
MCEAIEVLALPHTRFGICEVNYHLLEKICYRPFFKIPYLYLRFHYRLESCPTGDMNVENLHVIVLIGKGARVYGAARTCSMIRYVRRNPFGAIGTFGPYGSLAKNRQLIVRAVSMALFMSLCTCPSVSVSVSLSVPLSVFVTLSLTMSVSVSIR